MNWARRLKRVFGIEIEGCARCGGKLRIIARIEDPQVIAKILSHLERTAPEQYQTELPLGARHRRCSPACCELEMKGDCASGVAVGFGGYVPGLRSGRKAVSGCARGISGRTAVGRASGRRVYWARPVDGRLQAPHKAGSANKTGHGRPVEIPIRFPSAPIRKHRSTTARLSHATAPEALHAPDFRSPRTVPRRKAFA
jgi:hypothetical protein